MRLGWKVETIGCDEDTVEGGGCCRERDGEQMKVVEKAPGEGGSRIRMDWGLWRGCGMEILAVSGHWLDNSVC